MLLEYRWQATPSDNGSVINRQNHVDLLSHVFAVYVGDIYNRPLIEISEFNITGRNPDGSFIGVFDCQTGSFNQNLDPTSTNAGVFFNFDFDMCNQNGVIHDGIINGQNGGRGLVFDMQQYSIQPHPELFSTYSGSAQKFDSQSGFFDAIHSWDTWAFMLDSHTIDGSLTIGSMTSGFVYGNSDSGSGIDRAWLRGEFTLRSDATSGATIDVSTLIDFVYELNTRTDIGEPLLIPVATRAAWNFTSGQLELIGEDGSRLLLDADNDDAATVSITISNDDGTDTFDAPWSQWQRVLRFDSFPAESPDWVSAISRANPDAEAGPAITPENYTSLLNYGFDLFAGQGYLEPIKLAQGLMSVGGPVSTERARGVRTDSFNCDSDGNATVFRVDDDSSAVEHDYRVSFDSCELDGYQLSGNIRGREIRTGGGAQSIIARRLLWLDSAGDEGRFIGEAAIGKKDRVNESLCRLQTNNLNILSLPDDPDSVIGADRDFYKTFFEVNENAETGTVLTIDGSMSVTSSATGWHAITFLFNQLKTAGDAGMAEEDRNFIEGRLMISADDGSRLSIGDGVSTNIDDASQVSPGTHVLIHNSQGGFDIQTPWTEWRSRLGAARHRICGEP